VIKTLLVPVAVAGRLLSASEGTVAAWLDEGLLTEWERAPKRRIVDVKEAFLLCGLRHDLQQVTPEVAAALDIQDREPVDRELAARLAVAYAGPTGLPAAKLEPAIGRHLAYGYRAAEIEECLDRLTDYRARRTGSAPVARGERVPAHADGRDHEQGRVQVHGRAAVARYHS
jgi:hypothetical protein